MRLSITVDVSACVGIEKPGKASTFVEVYPNPNTGPFTLVFARPGFYKLINALGQTIDILQVETTQDKVSFQNLPNGVYYLTGKGFAKKICVTD